MTNRRIIDYYVLSSSDVVIERAYDKLENLIRKYISGGWQPLGGISTTFVGSETRSAQAMVKYEEEPKTLLT